jgi:hypothetical protein
MSLHVGEGELAFTGWRDFAPAYYYNTAQQLIHQERRSMAIDDIAAHLRHAHSSTRCSRSRLRQHVRELLSGGIYQFGVYTGGGLAAWLHKLRAHRLHFTGTLFGFDSFVGMPTEDQAHMAPEHRRNRAWQAGGLNAAERIGIKSWPELRDHIVKHVRYAPNKTVLVRGWFNETLAPANKLAEHFEMRPAFLVDLDSDLYSSAVDALRFMLDRRLARPGTFLYNDDVTTRNWKEAKAKWAAGVRGRQRRTPAVFESARALLEAVDDYGLVFDEIGPAPNSTSASHPWRLRGTSLLLRLRRVCARGGQDGCVELGDDGCPAHFVQKR